jgi:structural maintenance of chromosome 1
LKEQRVGTATFIPLDKIKVKPIPEKLRLLGGTAKPIIDVLKYLFVFLSRLTL